MLEALATALPASGSQPAGSMIVSIGADIVGLVAVAAIAAVSGLLTRHVLTRPARRRGALRVVDRAAPVGHAA